MHYSGKGGPCLVIQLKQGLMGTANHTAKQGEFKQQERKRGMRRLDILNSPVPRSLM